MTGLNDRSREKHFVWSDGSLLDYTFWNNKEPNDNTGRENCVEMTANYGGWNDLDCNQRRGYVCKKELGNVVGITILSLFGNVLCCKCKVKCFIDEVVGITILSLFRNVPCCKRKVRSFIGEVVGITILSLLRNVPCCTCKVKSYGLTYVFSSIT